MKLRELMSREVEVVHSNDTLEDAARKMRQWDVGILPVYDNDQVVGVLTDRDIVLRAVASGHDPKSTLVKESMTSSTVHCFEDQSLFEVARLMQDHQVRRIVVLDRKNSALVGIISLGDLAANTDGKLSNKVLESVSPPVKVSPLFPT